MGPKREDVPSSSNTNKDKNAPKGPQNAYSLFYQNFHREYKRKNPHGSLEGRQLTQMVADTWRNLSDAEKKPFQDQAKIEREKYAAEMAKYQKSDKYKQFMAENKSSTKMIGNIEVYSKEFLAFNKARESDLRSIRRHISKIDDQILQKNDSIASLKRKLDQSYKALPPTKRLNFERERQLLIWCRELICALDKAGLLTELGINYDTPADEIVQVISDAADNPSLGPKLKKLFSGFVLEIF